MFKKLHRPLTLVALLLMAAYITSSVVIAARSRPSPFPLTHSTNHLEVQLLLVQYAFLLPALACYMLDKRMPDGNALPRTTLPVGTSYLMYAVLAAFVAVGVMHKDSGLQFGDELAYRFESRVFLERRLAADAPPMTTPDTDTYLEEFHFDHFIIQKNRWTGIFPPGWPVVLALGTALHHAWLVNPLLGLWILWISYRIATLVFDRDVGRLAVLLMVASPSFLLNSVGFMSHPLCGVLLSAASLLLFHGLESRPMLNFSGMLLLVGFAALVRQWTAFCVGGVLGITALWSLRYQRRQWVSLIVIATLVGTAAAAILLSYNHALTGSYWRSTYAVAENRNFSTNFNISPLSILRGIVVVSRRSFETTDLYAVPFLLLLAAYALFAETERRRSAYVLGALFAALIIGYTAQPLGSASTVGERYYYESFFAIAILGARGWCLLRPRWSLNHVRVGIAVIGAVCCFHYALAIRDVRIRATPHICVMDAIEGLRLTDTVVYVKGDIASHFNENAADWRHAPVFYMMDPGPSRRAVIAGALQRSRWSLVTTWRSSQRTWINSATPRKGGTTIHFMIKNIPIARPHCLERWVEVALTGPRGHIFGLRRKNDDGVAPIKNIPCRKTDPWLQACL
jgi:Dolichyl-phosphate-mannose-protein mannosyltransferase